MHKFDVRFGRVGWGVRLRWGRWQTLAFSSLNLPLPTAACQCPSRRRYLPCQCPSRRRYVPCLCPSVGTCLASARHAAGTCLAMSFSHRRIRAAMPGGAAIAAMGQGILGS